MTHCVRPKSSRKFRKCVPAGLEGPESHGFCLALKSPRTKMGKLETVVRLVERF